MRRNTSFAAFFSFLIITAPGCLAFVTNCLGQQLSAPQTNIPSLLIKSPVVVFDEKERYRKKLNQEDFILEVENTVVPISHFNNQATAASVVFLVDVSGSMQSLKSKVSHYSFLPEAMRRFLRLAHAENEYLVASFGAESRLRLDWTNKLSEVLDTLTLLAAEKPYGPTNVRDACFFGLAQAMRGTKTKKVLILLSDGQDNSAGERLSITAKRLNQEILESDVQIFSVNITPINLSEQRFNPMMFGDEARNFLESIAKFTGGKTFYPRDAEGISISLEYVALNLDAQYEIGFTPPVQFSRQGRYKIKVRFARHITEKYTLKGISIRHREAFSISTASRKE